MKRILEFILCFILMFASIIFIYYHYKDKEVNDIDNEVLTEVKEDVITPLVEAYNNTDIKARLIIPGILDTPVVQTEDNEFYINHDLYKDINEQGTIYLDYRNKLNDKKILIYGHNNNPRTLIFNDLLYYKDEDFYNKHSTIYLYTKDNVKSYDIFSIYEENEDLSYAELNNTNDYSYYEHISNLKSKSLFENDIDLSGNSRIVILDTFITKKDNSISHFLVVGVEK